MHTDPGHFRTILACAEICRTAAYFMLLGSNFYRTICRECAAICEACEKRCRELGGMDQCADDCGKCAECCREVAA